MDTCPKCIGGNIVHTIKDVLATILKHTTSEFTEYDIPTIKSCIEGEPEVGTSPVFNSHMDADMITGSSTEDSVPGEGTVTYDIRFYVITPDAKRVKIIINVEAQNDYYPGYDLVTRGIFYGSRMLSSQLEREFTVRKDDKRKYDNLKKVYSIWICTDCPEKAQNTITSYDICQRKIYGNFRGKVRYDLMSVIMICLPKNINEDTSELLRTLSVLLSSHILYDEKKNLLEEMGIPMTREFVEEAGDMCNLSEGVERRGIEKGIQQGITLGQITEIISMGKDFNLSEEQIISRLTQKCNLSEDEARAKLADYQTED